ncbi:MAG: MFS transporter [Candidatus Korarchaeota archaeon]
MVSKKETIAYGMSQLATGMTTQAVNMYVYFFYLDTVGLKLALITLGMTIYGAWNMINDPLAGFISDRIKTRWGRRRPLIMFFTPILILSFIMLWMPLTPAGAPFDLWGDVPRAQEITFIYYTFFVSLFDTGFTFVGLAMASLFPEMAEKNEERVKLQMAGIILGSGGVAVGMFAFSNDVVKNWGIQRYQMAILVAPLVAFSLYALVLAYREKEEFVREKPLPLARAFKETFKNRSFLTFVMYNLMMQYISVIVMSMLPFVAKYVTNSDETMLLIGTGSGIGAGVICWSQIVKKRSPRQTAMIGLFIGSIGSVFFLLANDYYSVLCAAVIMGVGLGAAILLTNVLIANAIDYDETVTGIRREGIYYGFNAFIIRFSVILSAITSERILGLFGYISTSQEQPPSVATGVKIIVGLFPLLAMVVGILALYFYPLDGEKLAMLKLKIEEMHREKRKLVTG